MNAGQRPPSTDLSAQSPHPPPPSFPDVVGITNYLDIGFQMSNNLAGSGPSSMALAASWQANKNVALKARAGLEGVAGGCWWVGGC
jgi:hypothetical protein